MRWSDVHVWTVWLDRVGTHDHRLAATLSAAERVRAERYRSERDRNRFVVRRGVLRILLGRYLGVEPGRLEFCRGPRGKPALAGPARASRLCFSLSHSDGLAVLAVTWSRPVGVDVERVRPLPHVEQIAERCFAASERAALRAFGPDDWLEAFFNCWTRKEAYLKATGDGLARGLDGLDVSLTPGEPARLLRVDSDLGAPTRWSLRSFTPAAGYVAALAAAGNDWQIACRWWSG